MNSLANTPPEETAMTRSSALRAIKDEIADLIVDAGDIVSDTEEAGRAQAYWIAHIRAALGALDDIEDMSGVPAGEIEDAVIVQVRALLRTPEMAARMMRAARTSTNGGALNSEEVAESLQRLDAIWEELFPAEQARILRLLVKRLEVGTEGIDLRLRVEGLHSLVAELREAERTEGMEETAA